MAATHKPDLVSEKKRSKNPCTEIGTASLATCVQKQEEKKSYKKKVKNGAEASKNIND